VNLNFVNFLGVNPPFLVHKSLVHKILVHKIQVHKSLGHRKFGIFLWFTFFLSSQISSEPVNHGSQITPAPKNVVIFWCNLCSINTKNLMLMAAFVRTFYQNVFMDAEAYLRQLYYFELKIYPLASNELLMFSLACLVRKIYQNQCRRFLVIFDHNVQSYCGPLTWPMVNFIILN